MKVRVVNLTSAEYETRALEQLQNHAVERAQVYATLALVAEIRESKTWVSDSPLAGRTQDPPEDYVPVDQL